MSQPPSASSSPRFCNTGKFMRLPPVPTGESMDFAILGIPFDTASSYRTGARFGPSAIRQISAMIKPSHAILEVNILEYLRGEDLGDIAIVPDFIAESYKAIEEGLDKVVTEECVPLCLGGDHSVTLAEMRSVAKKHGKLSMIHFDSHLDLNDLVFGQKYNHGTVFRRAMEEGLIDPSTSIQLGMRGSLYDQNDFKTAEDLGFQVIPGHKLHEMGIEKAGDLIRKRVGKNKAFLTLDIDFIDPAYAPGTGTPEVGGFTTYETLSLLREAKELHYVGFDVVEVAPCYDSQEITSYAAANIAFEMLSFLAYQKKNGMR